MKKKPYIYILYSINFSFFYESPHNLKINHLIAWNLSKVKIQSQVNTDSTETGYYFSEIVQKNIYAYQGANRVKLLKYLLKLKMQLKGQFTIKHLQTTELWSELDQYETVCVFEEIGWLDRVLRHIGNISAMLRRLFEEITGIWNILCDYLTMDFIAKVTASL